MTLRSFKIYRYDPDTGAAPALQSYEVELDGSERMLLDALMKLKYDLYYIKNQSVLLDLFIICKTVAVVLAFRGT